ncbi:MAG: transposase family protein [Candidatus Competibacteraceae bacterium]
MSVMIQLPLDIPEVKVLSTECQPDGALLIKVESTRQGTCCSRCGREIHQFHGYDRPIQLRHLPILERRVYLEIRPKRYRCPACEGRPTTTQRCDRYEPNRLHTQAFEKWVLRCLVNSTVVDVSQKLGLGPDAVEGILGRWLSTTVDWSQFTTLETLGIDEIALTAGARQLCGGDQHPQCPGEGIYLSRVAQSPESDRQGVSGVDSGTPEGDDSNRLYRYV